MQRNSYAAFVDGLSKSIAQLKVGHGLDRAKRVGSSFQNRLTEKFAQLELVGEVRGVGLLGAMEFVAERQTKRRFRFAA